MAVDRSALAAAIGDFHTARRKAALQELLARLTGRSTELLSYEEVRTQLRARASGRQRLEEIPLDAIVGSVGRHSDFTRSFLPLRDSDEQRWARVKAAVASPKGVPPIDVYQIGDAYFVLDGNHRVSVARQSGNTHIEAFVTEVHTRVPLTPDVEPDELICKAQYAGFLEQTHLDGLRPGADLSTSIPGQYRVLDEHVAVHRYYMGIDQQREVPENEAVAHWYDTVYMPVVGVLREHGVLWHFPERTETDLYVLLSEHRAALEKRLGWRISAEDAATDLAEQHSQRVSTKAARIGEAVRDAMTPDELESGPAPGTWRKRIVGAREDIRLFRSVLVALSGAPGSWNACDQALRIAQLERALLHGLHVTATARKRESRQARAAQDEFERRCAEAGVGCDFACEVGVPARRITERARWADLVVVHLKHPPARQPLAKVGSGMRTLIRNCGRPVLAVPGEATPLERPLLAYDGSPMADEALYVATYLAGSRGLPLTVVSVLVGEQEHAPHERARVYLESHGVEAEHVVEQGDAGAVIMQSARARMCDLIVMGGYGAGPVVEIVLGSTVDLVLRESSIPVLICR